MKNESVRGTIALTVFGTFLLSLACGTPAGNTNQPNGNVGLGGDTCTQPTAPQKAAEVEAKVRAKLLADPILAKHYVSPGGTDDPPPLKLFVRPGQYNFVEVEFQGDVSGSKKLEAVIDILDDFMHKGCVQKVALRSIPVAGEPIRDGQYAFIWNYCPHPTRPCDTGECHEVCPDSGGGTIGANVSSEH